MAANEEGDSELYCICRKPYNDEEFMIECNVCKDWFHGRLVVSNVTSIAVSMWACRVNVFF